MVYTSQKSQSSVADRFKHMLELLDIPRRQFVQPPLVSQQHITTWISRGKFGDAAIARFRELAEQRGVADFTGDWLNNGHGPEPRRLRDAAPDFEGAADSLVRDRSHARFQYLAGYSKEIAQFVDIPQFLLGNMGELLAPTVRVFINPGDALRGEIERGELVFVDTAVREVVGDGIYVYKLGGIAQIRRFQIRGTGVLRLQGTHAYEDSIELSGSEIDGLEIGGRVVGKIGYAKI